MTVRCPQCSTRYRLPPRSRLGRNPTYRCTRCRHVFAPDEEAEAPDLDEAEDEALLDDDEDDAPVFTIEPSRRTDDDEADDAAPATRRREAAASRAADSGITAIRFAARAALTVAFVYGIVSIYLHTHPERARDLFAAIPLVGEQMADARLNPGHIQLVEVRGEYKRVHGDRLVFVISGTAINNAPVAVASVQVEGRVIGEHEQQQVVYCGAAPQDVEDLGTREIDLLQTLKPSSDWLLRPGEQDRFLIAFVDPPTALTEFVAEVVGVRGTNGRAESPLPLAKRR
jgi:predicted Zn finger-like uncharacterized protein